MISNPVSIYLYFLNMVVNLISSAFDLISTLTDDGFSRCCGATWKVVCCEMEVTMSKTVYLKIRQLTKTDKQDVYLSDVAEVYAEKKLLPKIKSIKLATFYRTKKDRICISSMQVISAIQQLDDTLDVNNIGESDFIIDYRKNQQPVWLSVILKIIVCIIIFIGSAYAIMAYNNDVSTIEIFEKVYRMSGVDWLMEYNVCEIAYAIGLFAGIAVFYDHFAGKKMSKAPTPIEVSMNQYVKDENQAMIDSVECMPRCVRNNYPGATKC